ncbi:MAG: DUF4388 domain-containing protein [Myxococcota bacterium]
MLELLRLLIRTRKLLRLTLMMCFRRPIRLGCEWLVANGPSTAEHTHVAHTLKVFMDHCDGVSDLSPDEHIVVAFALLRKLVRHPGRRRDNLMLDRAVYHLRLSVAARPRDFWLYRALGTSLMLRGLKDGPETLQICRSMQPQLAGEIELDLLSLYLERGDEAAFAARFERSMISQGGTTPRTSLPDSQRLAVLAARIHRINERFEDALAVLRSARQRWPQSLDVSIELGEMLWRSGDIAGSLRTFSQMRSNHPTVNCTAWNQIAALAQAGQTYAARSALDQAPSDVAADIELLQLIEATSTPLDINPATDGSFTGDFSVVSLADAIGLLAQIQATGVLTVHTAGQPTVLHLHRGQFVEVHNATADGEPLPARIQQTLNGLLGEASGYFRFAPAPVAAPSPTAVPGPPLAVDALHAVLQATAARDGERKASG